MLFDFILNKISGDTNQKYIDKLLPIVDKINDIYKSWDDQTDEQIKEKTNEFKQRIQNGESLDSILPEAFANIKQACKRMCGKKFSLKGNEVEWNMIPYDVQLIGGIVLHRGKISEMKTGEGKTLVATLPAYLNALTGNGVHIVTVNNYLASRDAEWMGHLFNWLGLEVGSVVKETQLQNRKGEYTKDITYVENSELGFDYLRDNLTKSIEERVLLWRPLNYSIIDEVDSILIDEARTPLIISHPSSEPTEKYEYYNKIVKLLVPSKGKKKVNKGFLAEIFSDGKEEEISDVGDYYIDEKVKTATLSSQGIKKLEELLGVENLYKDLGYDEIHHIENALKANSVYIKDKDYLLKNNEVLIVDEHTGRAMQGRRYSQGLHQAIEAKESVKINRESKTMATITYQHFFKQYNKISGMTGTAVTEGEEFEKIYDLEVIAIPTNKPVIRVDKNDKVYFNQKAKWDAVVNNIKFYHEMGLPILIGTSSINTSEFVSSILKKISFPHYVLNAKFHAQEAEIVSNAGKKGSLVVATNMAGRGTDIKLQDGLNNIVAENYCKWIKTIIKGDTYSGTKSKQLILNIYSENELNILLSSIEKEFNFKIDKTNLAQSIDSKDLSAKLNIDLNYSKKNAGDIFAKITISPEEKFEETVEKNIHFGLFILGTEKHDSRRIDNQLRGRAGRQGDPGMSQFFVALDDEIMRKMGGTKIQSMAKMILPASELETLELTQKQFTSSITRSQKQMEGWHFGTRKHLFDYDSVLNKQRTRIYKKRDAILFSFQEDNEEEQIDLITEVENSVGEVVKKILITYSVTKPWNFEGIISSLKQLSGIDFEKEELVKYINIESLNDYITTKIINYFEEQTKGIEDKNKLKDYIKKVYLSIIDKYWVEHIDDMTYLREKVSLFGYAQIDPLVIYKKESYEKFQKLMANIKDGILSTILKTDFAFLENSQEIINEGVEKYENLGVMDLIKRVAGNVNIKDIQKKLQQEQNSNKINIGGGQKAKVLEKEDGIEVLELDENSYNDNVIINTNKKIRPNDKVSVKYKDGSIKTNKYKKLKEDIENGNCEIIR